MSKKIVFTGSGPNDGTGDTLRDAMGKINDNFTELYTGLSFVGLSNAATITANSTGFSNTDDVIFTTLADSKFPANTRIYYEVPSGNTPLAGLSGNTYYYVSFANSSSMALSSTLGGANIDITDNRTSLIAELHTVSSDVNSSIIFDTDSITVNNVIINTTAIFVGNSSINTVANSSFLRISNSSVSANLSRSELRIGATRVNTAGISTSSNLIINSTSIYILSDSSSTNTQITSNTYNLGNSTVNTTITTNTYAIANSTANSILTIGSLTLNSNSSIKTIVNGTSISIGNSTINTIANSSYLYVQTANVATNTGLTLGSSTSAANGYTYLPNGFKLNWGWVSANSSDGNATFTSAYTTNCWSVSSTSNSSVATYQASLLSVNNTVACIRTANATSTNVFWMAIGT